MGEVAKQHQTCNAKVSMAKVSVDIPFRVEVSHKLHQLKKRWLV